MERMGRREEEKRRRAFHIYIHSTSKMMIVDGMEGRNLTHIQWDLFEKPANLNPSLHYERLHEATSLSRALVDNSLRSLCALCVKLMLFSLRGIF